MTLHRVSSIGFESHQWHYIVPRRRLNLSLVKDMDSCFVDWMWISSRSLNCDASSIESESYRCHYIYRDASSIASESHRWHYIGRCRRVNLSLVDGIGSWLCLTYRLVILSLVDGIESWCLFDWISSMASHRWHCLVPRWLDLSVIDGIELWYVVDWI